MSWCLFGVRAFATIMMTKIGKRASGMLNVLPVKSTTGDTDLNSMGYCKKDVTPLLTHWSCVFLALIHRIGYANFCSISKFPLLFSIRRTREGSIFICQLNANQACRAMTISENTLFWSSSLHTGNSRIDCWYIRSRSWVIRRTGSIQSDG